MFKFLKNKQTRHDFVTYGLVILAFIVVSFMRANGMIPRMIVGQLVPICAYVVMAISLNLVVGVAGDLSLGHAGFMSVGAYTGIVAAMSLAEAVPNDAVRLVIALLVGAASAALAGFLVGIPVLRLSGDYLAIVTLAFGEIIKEVVTCLIVGVDENGIHVLFNLTGKLTVDDLGLTEAGTAIIKGAQGASGTDAISTFFAGFLLVMVALVIVLNLVRSRTGRAILAVRDNRIAAESVGISTVRYRMIAFVVSAALAGAAGALFGNAFSQLSATKFDFNTSILVLVFVVLGGLGNMRGSIIAATLLTILPEGRRVFAQMSVEENLEMGAFTRPNSEIAPGLERVYAHFPRLKERRRQVAGTLSGGEQQMLAMGRALMSSPKLLMLDEPSMGLAPILIEQIFDIVRELHAAGTTILLVEQNAQMALSIASRAYVMETGNIKGDASVFQEDDAVHMLDPLEVVGDHDEGLIREHIKKGREQLGFRHRVQAREGLVQHDDGGVR